MSKSVVKAVTSDELVKYTGQFLKGAGGELALPKNYDAVGAIKSFHLALLETKNKEGKPALESCTKTSIYKAALELVTKGLDVRKKQAYPIVYGNQLQLQVGYFGNQKLAKTYMPELGDFNAQVILKGDEYETAIEPSGRKRLVKHVQEFGTERNLDNIIGAYSVVEIGTDSEGNPVYDLEDMTIAQIKQAWAKGRSSQQTHKEFSEQMAKKTVISRHATRLINSTDDSAVMGEQEDVPQRNVIEMQPVTIETVQDEPAAFVEPDEMELPDAEGFDDDGEWSEEEMAEAINESSDILTVKYGEWTKEYKPTNEWEDIKDSYNASDKTIQIRRKA